jgi:hypothetical protein
VAVPRNKLPGQDSNLRTRGSKPRISTVRNYPAIIRSSQCNFLWQLEQRQIHLEISRSILRLPPICYCPGNCYVFRVGVFVVEVKSGYMVFTTMFTLQRRPILVKPFLQFALTLFNTLSSVNFISVIPLTAVLTLFVYILRWHGLQNTESKILDQVGFTSTHQQLLAAFELRQSPSVSSSRPFPLP